MADDLPEVLVCDARAWHTWPKTNHAPADSALLVLARKGVTDPTSRSHDQALEAALCFGWIDGQARRIDMFVSMLARGETIYP